MGSMLLWNAMLGMPNNVVSYMGTRASGLFVCAVLAHQTFRAPFYETPHELRHPNLSCRRSQRQPHCEIHKREVPQQVQARGDVVLNST